LHVDVLVVGAGMAVTAKHVVDELLTG